MNKYDWKTVEKGIASEIISGQQRKSREKSILIGALSMLLIIVIILKSRMEITNEK